MELADSLLDELLDAGILARDGEMNIPVPPIR